VKIDPVTLRTTVESCTHSWNVSWRCTVTGLRCILLKGTWKPTRSTNRVFLVRT